MRSAREYAIDTTGQTHSSTAEALNYMERKFLQAQNEAYEAGQRIMHEKCENISWYGSSTMHSSTAHSYLATEIAKKIRVLSIQPIPTESAKS